MAYIAAITPATTAVIIAIGTAKAITKGISVVVIKLKSDENPAARSFIAIPAPFNTRANVLGNASLEIPNIAKKMHLLVL